VSGRQLALATAAIAVIALAVAGALALGGDDNDPREAASATTTEDSSTAEPSRTEPATPREDEPDEGSARPEGDEPEPESQAGAEAEPEPEEARATAPARFVPYSGGSGDWQAELPAGNGWKAPNEAQLGGGRRYRVTVRGPAGAVLLIDHMPSAAARFGSKYESRRELTQPWFGSMTEYKLGDTAVGYVLNASEAGPGFRVFATGVDGSVARRVADSLTFVDL
jgi:hypothetical protein